MRSLSKADFKEGFEKKTGEVSWGKERKWPLFGERNQEQHWVRGARRRTIEKGPKRKLYRKGKKKRL